MDIRQEADRRYVNQPTPNFFRILVEIDRELLGAIDALAAELEESPARLCWGAPSRVASSGGGVASAAKCGALTGPEAARIKSQPTRVASIVATVACRRRRV